jgi:outer membrane receptor for ferrienterochelin and colicin
MNRSATALTVLCLLVCSRLPAVAQGDQTGVIRGTVTDSQRLPLPGVTVTARSPVLQSARTTTTEENGTYVLPLLPSGMYDVTYETAQFRTVETQVDVPLGSAVVQNALLAPGVNAEVVVTTAAELSTSGSDFTVTQQTVDSLPTGRTLHGIATLSPGLNENTPNARQVTINGAFSFDNVFMIDGVDVNDNLLGTPQNLFIEDAIAETQVLTSGISAEYGRFSGGVINAVTKSGGNLFGGSLRVNLANPAWSTETPFEAAGGTSYIDTLNESYEGTFGGPIVRERVWFFAAGRYADATTTRTFNVTGVPYTFGDENRRLQGKLTATVVPNHTLQVGYVNNSRKTTNRLPVPDSVEISTLDDIDEPNWYAFGNYRAVLSPRVFTEAQYSERRYRVDGLGGTSTDIRDSPFVSVATNPDAFYNGPYFDASDPESRNNRQLAGSLTLIPDRNGRHEVKAGYDWFRSQRRGGNSQSSTGYVFITDFAVDAGQPVLDAAGRLIPVFDAATGLERWTAAAGATLNVDTQSLFVQDHWRLSDRVSADVGLRFERVHSEATGGVVGVHTSTIVPRLAVAWDVTGAGALVLSGTYGHYAGRYNEAQIGRNSNVGNADRLDYSYVGPAGSGFDFAPGFDLGSYEPVGGNFPAANVRNTEGLHTPVTREFTASAGAAAGRRGYAELTYVWRDTNGFIEDFSDLTTGQTDVVRDGELVTTLTNTEFRNTDDLARRYQAAIVQGRYRVRSNWTAQAAWTVQLQNEGNYVGEAPNNPGRTTLYGDYPEAFSASRNFPVGRLQGYQRHRARLWTIYDLDLESRGDLRLSALWRLESGRAYSNALEGVGLTEGQASLLGEYASRPFMQDVFFGGRGTETFPGYGLLDVAANYAVPILGPLAPWVKAELFNLLNNQKVVRYNTTIIPVVNPESPVDALGLPTAFRRAESFGQPFGAGSYPTWAPGETGGRTFRLSAGIRF